MLFELIKLGQAFLEANPFLVAMVIGVVEGIKRVIQDKAWFEGWMNLVSALLVGFAFAIPEAGFADIDVLVFVSQGIALSGVSAGLFAAASSISKKTK